MNTRTTLTTTLCALALTAGPAYADAGGVDSSFGEGGTIRLDGPDDGTIVATAVRPDGRIVAVSTDRDLVRGTTGILVYRLLPDGTLDRSFDRDGVAKIRVAIDDIPHDVEIAPDGKVLIAGSVSPGQSGTTDAVVYRLLADGGPGVTNGALDPSFDGDGAAMLDSAGDETATALALRPDGKIVVAGNAVTSATALDIVVYRLKADGGPGPVNGALDPAFDRDGAAGVDTGAGETAAAMELRPDGSVVVAGSARSGSNEHAIIAQLRPDGGDGGVNGALDASFDRDGVAGISGAGRDGLRAIALQPDGKIVVAGHTSTAPGASPDGVVYRLNARGGPGALNGALDATFGNDGRLVFETTDEDDEIQAVELQPDGRILAAGWRAIKGSRAVVYRLAPDGRALASGGLDPSFGAGGIATFPASSAFDVVHGLALAPDGGIVAGGFAYLSPRVRQPIVGRLLGDAAPQPAGTPDQPGPSVGQPTGDVVTAAFGARTRVTLRVGKRSKTGRVKVRVVNANGFMVRGKLAAKGAKTRSFRVPARTTRTITLRLPRRRGRARVAATVVDPAGNSRVVRALAR